MDRAWSIHVRYTAVDQHGLVECFTCGKRDQPSIMHCGHFASRRYMATRWHPDNCRPQCVACNIYDQGRQFEFGRRLDLEEPGKAERVFQLARSTRKFSVDEIVELAKQVERQNTEIRGTME